MRIALVVHAFPPRSQTGVEVYTEALAKAFAAAGHEVEVLACFRERAGLHLEQRREQRAGFGVTWLRLAQSLDDEDLRRTCPGASAACARWLGREQPDVLHIQHFLGFGAQIIDVARQQLIPVVFSAHDGFALCDEYTLITPDFQPLDPADRRALARCRLARGVLDKALAAHDGYMPVRAVPKGLRREMDQVLGESSSRVDELATQLDRQLRARLEAVDRADHIHAPTQFLAQWMKGMGLRSEVEVRSCGIDSAPLRRTQQRSDPAGQDQALGPLRVLYLGGYFEHKGVHILLQAAQTLRSQVEVHLRGCGGSSGYLQHLEGLAQHGPVHLGGAFDREQLPGLLHAADVLVLPSLWPENAPFVLREAFAAGVPVLVSDTPALRESVAEEVDGRFVLQGDVDAWRAALQSLASDRQALFKLQQSVREPKSILQDAAEWIEIYEPLIKRKQEAAQARREALPEHLWGFAQSHQELQGLSTSELSERVLEGLQALAEKKGLGLSELKGARAWLPESAGLRERIAEGKRALAWRAETAEDQARALASALARIGELEALVDNEQERGAWQQEQLQDRDATLDALGAELGLCQRTLEELRGQEREGTRALQSSWKENQWLREQAATVAAERDAMGLALEQKVEQLQAAEALLDEQQKLASAKAQELGRAHQELEAQAKNDRYLKEEFDELLEAHAELQGERSAARCHEQFLEQQLTERAQEFADLTQQAQASGEQLAELAQELDWRRTEMREAKAESQRIALRFFGRRLGKRLSAWEGSAEPLRSEEQPGGER